MAAEEAGLVEDEDGVFVDDRFESTGPALDSTGPALEAQVQALGRGQPQSSSVPNSSRKSASISPYSSRSSMSSLSSTTRRQSSLDEEDWNQRHHLNGSENELKPRGLRDYFAKIQTVKELKRDLKYNPKLSNTNVLLKSMSFPEVNDRKPSFICPDAGPPLVPTRHVFGGNMKDRDGGERLWNDRWHKGISILNDNCHPDHRAYFTQKSLFEESPSQDWRRYLDQEVAHGVWKSIKCKRSEKFPPMGGRLRGRSGTPIPGASP